MAMHNYLALPDAGHKKKALQHASQMKLLLEAMEPGNDNLECLGGTMGTLSG